MQPTRKREFLDDMSRALNTSRAGQGSAHKHDHGQARADQSVHAGQDRIPASGHQAPVRVLKVRYCSLVKNKAQLMTLFVLFVPGRPGMSTQKPRAAHWKASSRASNISPRLEVAVILD